LQAIDSRDISHLEQPFKMGEGEVSVRMVVAVTHILRPTLINLFSIKSIQRKLGGLLLLSPRPLNGLADSIIEIIDSSDIALGIVRYIIE
jgi:hypothetical protein